MGKILQVYQVDTAELQRLLDEIKLELAKRKETENEKMRREHIIMESINNIPGFDERCNKAFQDLVIHGKLVEILSAEEINQLKKDLP